MAGIYQEIKMDDDLEFIYGLIRVVKKHAEIRLKLSDSVIV
jgi:hypothetical protein